MIGSIISAIVFGIVVGAIARLIVPGKQHMSLTMTWIVGVVAALLGTLVAYFLGLSRTPGINWWQHIIQILFAVVGVLVVARAQATRGTH
ncbi:MULTISPECIES: GlsB/YeaQ/YmgE family stress response membrane protein [unclassified Nonomuraea]|uniref:GlsB/YeaQ/YmgE family stress response membrane protein n=1 Tax=Nonomuraea sp. NPDC003804 TaxID=3154547 RepID=UPI0033B1D86E